MSMLFRLGSIAVLGASLLAPVAGAQAPANPAAPIPPVAAPGATTPPAVEPAPPAPPPPPPPPAGFTLVGKEFKPIVGKVVDVEKGDAGCLVIIADAKNREFIELGAFELCTRKPPLKGKKIEVEYKMESVMAASCDGNPKCTKKETVPYLASVKVVD